MRRQLQLGIAWVSSFVLLGLWGPSAAAARDAAPAEPRATSSDICQSGLEDIGDDDDGDGDEGDDDEDDDDDGEGDEGDEIPLGG